MSLTDVPQRLVSRLVGRAEPTVKPDDPIARMIARTSRRIRPERSYRWRLRGRLVNQYVAVHEGLIHELPARTGMGALGRVVLYASVALAISVTGVAAASTSALPGDPLFAVKRQVEDLRMEIAPPSVRPMLAAMAVEERLSEVELLAASGDWRRVAFAEREVEGAVTKLQAIGGSLPAEVVAELARHTQVLSELLARAPQAARAGLERALAASASAAIGLNPGNRIGQENQQGRGPNLGAAPNQGTNGNPTGNGRATGGGAAQTNEPPSPTPAPTSKPTHTPATQAPYPTPPASPTPSGDGADQGGKLPAHPR